MSLSKILLNWYSINKRELPWRFSSNPYHIWVSEVILQQTRVAQGLPYFLRFIEHFPSVEALATAEEKVLLKVWQGLGYYSRARNLQAGAKYVCEHFNGILPADYNEILKIKGVGEYTAAAICSIAFNLPYPVVDGNVNRFISRLFGIQAPVDTNSGKKLVRSMVNELFDIQEPGKFNQAVMEFGALHCIPQKPDCTQCPFAESCVAYKNNLVGLLPVKKAKEPVTSRYFYYLVIDFDNRYFIHKRGGKDIWKGLYEFPLIELPEKLSVENLINHVAFNSIFGNNSFMIYGNARFLTQKLTHRKIETCFLKVRLTQCSEELAKHYEIVEKDKLYQFPVSGLIQRYLDMEGL
jgi:A/G-specific adenine glycosylase